MNYLLLGGTGTLGQATTQALLTKGDTEKITIISRDELKQKQMAARFENDVRLKFQLGDIRSYQSVSSAVEDIDVCFHFAALKHIEVVEDNPEESVRTNILGSMNVADACTLWGVPYCVFSSTDKAVDPINVYGNCKAISERIFFRKNETQDRTKFAVYRWGNVFGSRGSAIQAFMHSLKKDGTVHVTDMEMSRFWIRIEDAVEFMLKTYDKSPTSTPSIPDIKAASLVRVIRAVANEIGVSKYEIKLTGMRKGEKMHEALLTQHEDAFFNSRDYDQYDDDELQELVGESIRCLS